MKEEKKFVVVIDQEASDILIGEIAVKDYVEKVIEDYPHYDGTDVGVYEIARSFSVSISKVVVLKEKEGS